MAPLDESEVPNLALGLGLSPRMAKLLLEMYNRTIVTYDDLGQHGVGANHRVMIGRMRRLLEGTRVQIQTKHGTGYWLDSVSRGAIRDTLERVKSAAPEGGSNE